MKNRICRIVLASLFLSLFACNIMTGKEEAEKVAESQFRDRIENGGFGSEEYYSELFWKSGDEEKWSNIKNLVNKAMGDLLSYSLNTWKVESNVNTSEISGTIVVLVYDTVYEKGNGTETLTIHKPLLGDKFSIIGHNFNSKIIQELIDKGIEHAASGDSE